MKRSLIPNPPKATRLRIHRLTETEKRIGALLWPERGYWRPTTRADCASIQRPCPYVGCRHNLYLDLSDTAFHAHDCEPWNMVHSCALDVAEKGSMTLEEVGAVIGVTRERVRQVEQQIFTKIRATLPPHEAEQLVEALRRHGTGDTVWPDHDP